MTSPKKGLFTQASPEVVRAKAHEIDRWLAETVPTIVLTRRSLQHVLVGTNLVAAFHHFKAILMLVEAEMTSSAFALLRVEWQAMLNGMFILSCVPNDERSLSPYWKGTTEFPGIDQMVKRIEEKIGSKPLTPIKVDVGKSMNVYTHMGAPHLQRMISNERIGPNFSKEDVSTLLLVASIIAAYTAVNFGYLAGNKQMSERAVAMFIELQQGRLQPRPEH